MEDIHDIVDEVCYCGHLRSEHGDTIEKGHGKCMHMARISGCSCEKFTWREFVYKLNLDGGI